ncbi:MAG: fasciclin domain-containing protein [Nocardioides sp.]
MSTIRPTSRVVATIAAGALASAAAIGAAPAQAAPTGTTSLAEVLAADGNKLDGSWDDFDIVEKAVYAVLEAKPGSPVALLADGDTALTAFVPTDRAFRKLVTDLTGDRKGAEKGVWRTLKTIDADTIETVLLYHVVPGATIRYAQAKAADGVTLDTAQGGTVKVNVVGDHVRLQDADKDDKNATVIRAAKNINKGNVQIAHGVDRVLRPIDL